MPQQKQTNAQTLKIWEHELDRAVSAVNRQKAASKNFSAFVFLTDVHWEHNNKNAVLLAKELMSRLSIKRFVFGGDIIMCQMYKQKAHKLVNDFLRHLSLLGEDGFYAVRGNHDCNGPLPPDPDQVWTDDEFYDVFMKYSNNKNTDGTKKLYNYSDDPEAKIRYYFLDTYASGQFPPDPGKLNSVPYDVQLKWLSDTASELDNDWGIAVIQHRNFNGCLLEQIPRLKERALIPTINDRDFPEFDQSGRVISPIIHLKKGDRYPVCDEFTTALIPVLNRIAKDPARPEIIGVITGHTHYDAELKTDGGYSIIATTCDAGESSSRKYDNYNPYRIQNTTSGQAFDIVGIDRTNHKLFFTRIGPGHDREFTY